MQCWWRGQKKVAVLKCSLFRISSRVFPNELVRQRARSPRRQRHVEQRRRRGVRRRKSDAAASRSAGAASATSEDSVEAGEQRNSQKLPGFFETTLKKFIIGAQFSIHSTWKLGASDFHWYPWSFSELNGTVSFSSLVTLFVFQWIKFSSG